MIKLHTLWAVICCILTLSFFVAGRWSVLSETGQISLPVSSTGARQQSAENPTAIDEKGSTAMKGAGLDARVKNVTLFSPQSAPKHRSSLPAAKDTIPAPAQAESGEVMAEEMPVLPPPPEETAMQEQEQEALQEEIKEELVQSLKSNGLSDEEIKEHVEGFFPPPADRVENEPQQPEELTLEQQREQIAASLRQPGLAEEEIDVAMKGLLPPEAGDESEQHGGEER